MTRLRLSALLGTALLACSLGLQAQTPPASGPAPEAQKGHAERHGQMREHMKSAMEACKGKDDRRACMREQMCAKSKDPAKCHAEGKARMTRHMEERQKAHEACTGKRGDELMTCLESQRPQRGKGEEHRHGKPDAKG